MKAEYVHKVYFLIFISIFWPFNNKLCPCYDVNKSAANAESFSSQHVPTEYF